MKIWPFAIALLIVILGAGYYEYGLLQQINANVTKISLVNVNLREATVSFDLQITNPADIPVYVDAIRIDIHAVGKTIARIEDTSPFDLPRNGEAKKTLIAKIPLADLGMAGIAAFQRGELDWELDGSADVRVLGVPQTKTFAVQNNKA